jgi:flagellin
MRLVSSASATATTRALEARGEHLLHLGTGKRVLRAADDAAGLAVSAGLSLRARLATREVHSFQAGLRFTSAVEGDAEAVQAQLQRMRELAVASASEGSAAAARASMQVEFASALDEINRHGAAAAEAADRIRLEAADPIPSLARMMAPRRVDLMTLVATAEGMGAAQRGLAAALPAFSAGAAAAGADFAWGLAAAVQTVEGGSAAVDTADGLRTDRSIGLWSAAELQALIKRFASDTLTRVGPDGERVAQHDPLRALLELAGLRDTAGQLEGDAAQWRPGAERHVLLVNNSLSDATSALEAVGTTRGLAEALARVGVVVHVASAV